MKSTTPPSDAVIPVEELSVGESIGAGGIHAPVFKPVIRYDDIDCPFSPIIFLKIRTHDTQVFECLAKECENAQNSK